MRHARKTSTNRAPRGGLWTRLLITAVAAAAAVAVVEPAVAAAAPKAAAAAPSADPVVEAKRTGKPQEVVSQTTETTQVFAEPDGSYRMHKSALPTRVRKDGAWREIDTTLQTRSDGLLAPKASTADIAFSPGGDGPAITFTDGADRLSLYWKGSLPKPVVEGAKAVYHDVLPGVDLRLTAETTGFSQVLVVHNAEAARQPGLRELRFTAVGTGVRVDSGADGVFNAVDSAGKTVFQGSTPVMWDSTTDQTAPARVSDKFGSGRVARIGARTERGTDRTARPAANTSTVDVVITPDQRALTGSEVEYPVYIDPVYSKSKANFAEFTNNGWYYFDANMDAQVGRCEWSGCGTTFVARSFFRFTTPELQDRNGRKAVLRQAYFYAWQTHGTSCTDESITLYLTGEYNGSTRWPGPGGTAITTVGSHAGDQCGGTASVSFNAFNAVQTTINNNAATMVLALMSPDEGNKYQWKKFINNPSLDVYFSFPPQQPAGLGVQNAVLCNGQTISSTATPTLLASAVDNNAPPLDISLGYDLYNYPGNQKVASGATTTASGNTGGWTVPSPVGDGAYYMRVSSTNVFPGQPGWGVNSGATTDYWFDVMAAPLAKTPVINPSTDYPRNQWGAPANAPGVFNLSYEGGGIAGFAYTWGGSGTETVPTTADCDYDRSIGTSGGWVSTMTGNATIAVPTWVTPGPHTLYVKAFDRAHKMSAESQAYEFFVSPNLAGSGQTWLEAENLAVSQPAGQNQTVGVQGNCCGIYWSAGAQMWFRGTAAGQSFTLDVPVGTTGDYQFGAGMTLAADYGTTSFQLDGVPVGQTSDAAALGTPLDNYTTSVRHRHVDLGSQRLTAGTHKLTVTMAGTNPSSINTRYMAGVDYISLSSTSRWEAENSAQVAVTQPAGQNRPLAVDQTTAGSGGPWSQGAARRIDFNAPGQSLRTQFSVPIAADYSLGIGALSNQAGAKYTYRVDDIPLNGTDTQPWGRSTANPDTVEHLSLGGLHLTAGPHTLSVTLTTPDPSGNERFWLDYLRATPINNASAADFGSAMNNKGFAATGSIADLDLNHGGLTPQSLSDVGLAPGSVKTVDGATFVLPAATTTGDNVVALGQRIPFPGAQQVKASAVGLLAISTCGESRPNTATITYTDGSTQNPVVPAVPDWTSGPGGSALPPLALATIEGVAQTGFRPRVYPVFVPSDPTKTLQSITLPNYGTSLLRGCGTAALHVLAMAPRSSNQGWVGTWGAPADTVAAPPGGAGFANQTLRTVVRPIVSGPRVRIRLANPFTTQPVTIDAATLGAQSGTSAATLATPAALTFAGSASVTIPAGGEVTSDDITYPSTTGGSGALVVSTHITAAVTLAPVHALTTSPTFLASGNQAAQSAATAFATQLTGTHYLSGIEVSTATPSDASKGTVVVVGDQFTGGSANNWVEQLPGRLAANGESVPGGLVDSSRLGAAAAGWWKLNEGTGTTAADSSGAGANATLNGPVGWSTEHGGAAVFNGSNTLVQTSGSVLNTLAPFTVSAWVKLTTTAHTSAVVSQSQSYQPPYVLEYNAVVNAWAITAPSQDVSTPSAYPVAKASGPPALNTWTHLVATADPASGDMALYVNGVLAGTGKNPTPFATSGPLTIGGVKSQLGPNVSMFEGQISDVRVYRNQATAEDAAILFSGGAPTGPTAGVGAATLSSAAKRVNDTVYAKPALRTVVLSVGANDILAGADKNTLLQRVSALSKAANPGGVRNLKRLDGAPVHVIMTTVAPMGLAAGDPREQVRRDFNTELLNNYFNLELDGVIDAAGAVQDNANPNQVASGYLTGGKPNTGYHLAVANAVALAVVTFPPVEL